MIILLLPTSKWKRREIAILHRQSANTTLLFQILCGFEQ